MVESIGIQGGLACLASTSNSLEQVFLKSFFGGDEGSALMSWDGGVLKWPLSGFSFLSLPLLGVRRIIRILDLR